MKRSDVKLCLGTSTSWGLPLEELIALIKQVGFDGIFVNWSREIDISKIKALTKELGLIFQSIHAPYESCYLLWEGGEGAKKAVEELLACLEDCHKNSVPIMVCHAFIGFDKHTPTDVGVENFRIIFDKARAYGVKIALENTEGEEYLARLMQEFVNYENVGFCWDTGHEMCYNLSKDMLSLYGDRLFSTHINDNLGVTDPENIFWTDDLHLLPFDGIKDWQDAMDRLDRHGYKGEMTFELRKSSKPNRHENDKYEQMSASDYVKEIYIRACKLAEMRR